MNPLDSRLAAGMEALALPHTPQQRDKLLAFLALMQKWNRAYNLTAIRDLGAAVDLHLLDSLAVSPHLPGGRVLDVGTGAGLPGIPLAVLREDCAFTLLDSSAKKTRFVQQAIIELGLKNVDVATARVEQYRPGQGYGCVLCRAFASLETIVSSTSRLLAPGGRILAQKGVWPQAELATLKNLSVRVHRLAIPGVEAERHLVEIMVDS